jgi:dolichol-phosphate mannosyltransferase
LNVLVVLPTYNEAENIALLLPELLKLSLDVCVVDDSSPDGTGDIAAEFVRRDARVKLVRRAGKLGLGTAYVAGWRVALEQGYDAALTMDADFSHHPRYIPAMITAATQADLVIGSRYVRGGAVLYPFHRRFLSQTSNLVARVALGIRAHDCTAGFRLYRTALLRKLPLDAIRSGICSALARVSLKRRSSLKTACAASPRFHRARCLEAWQWWRV